MPISAEQATFVRELVYRRSAIVLDESKHYLIESRLDQLARDTGFASSGALISEAQRGSATVQTRLVESITTNETLFFRDVEPFEALRLQVLPRLIAARAATRRLTIWSAACSTGQEPYSIAMILRESFPDQTAWPIAIFASDLAASVLDRARSGRYRQAEIGRGLPARLLVRFFERDGADWIAKPELRKMIGFFQHNLIEPFKLAFRPDVVFLRNVLIYFDLATQRRVLEQVRSCLAPDGALFLGAAESASQMDDGWERVACGKTAYYRPRG